jgi:hypothetical protein
VFERMARAWVGAGRLSELAFPVQKSKDYRVPALQAHFILENTGFGQPDTG